jgi:hypothetical protein
MVLARVAHLTTDLFEKAIMMTTSYQIPLWDAQIVAAASLGSASIILSEDFQHRHTLEGITFLNPFAPDFQDAEPSSELLMVCVHDKLPPPGMSLDARAKIFAQHSNRSPCGSKPRGV